MKQAKTPPVFDRKLGNLAWRETSPYTSYYEYWKSNPGEGKLKSYNASTIYGMAFRYSGKPPHENDPYDDGGSRTGRMAILQDAFLEFQTGHGAHGVPRLVNG